MLGPIYNAIGSLFGEDRSAMDKEEDLEDPEDFCPGLLFDISASWVLLVRRLLVPKAKSDPTCPAVCSCGCAQVADAGCSSAAEPPAKKKKGFSFFSCN